MFVRMSDSGQARRLAAILAGDVAGYSRLMGDDEAATVRTLTEYRGVFSEHSARHGGRVVDTAGDSVLAVFDSAVEAVECAVEIQKALDRRNRQLAEHRRMQFRIGINLGDVIARDDGTVYGDGVNIAARLESLASPGGITVSGTVFDHVENKLPVTFEFAGEQSVKNIAKPVRAYHVGLDGRPRDISPMSGTTAPKVNGRRARWSIIGPAVVFVLLVVSASGWYLTRTDSRTAGRPAVTAATADQSLSIAVMPFENLSGDAGQEFFADGVTDEILTTLSRFQDLRVAAKHNTFRYKGKTVDIKTVGEELRVRYVLSGSVRRSADTVRVSAQLVQADSGSQIWAETYDRPLDAKNIFAIQQQISLSIATAIGGPSGTVFAKEYSESQSKPPSNLTAYECFMRWSVGYLGTLSREDHRDSVECLERAVQLDPNYANLWAALATVYYDEYRFGYDPRPGVPLDRALMAANRAVTLAPQSQLAYRNLALTRYFRGERDAFFAAVEKAIQLNPNEPTALATLGTWVCYAGEWEKGMAMVKKALALDPRPIGWYYFPPFFDHYRKGQYEAALAEARKIDMNNFVWAQATLVAAYGQLGRTQEAQPSIKRILELDPNFEANARESRRKVFLYSEPLLEHFMDGLRKAGMKIPEKKR
jgi:adenylate cyclase